MWRGESAQHGYSDNHDVQFSQLAWLFVHRPWVCPIVMFTGKMIIDPALQPHSCKDSRFQGSIPLGVVCILDAPVADLEIETQEAMLLKIDEEI